MMRSPDPNERAAKAVSSSGGVREDRRARMLEHVFAGATAMLLEGSDEEEEEKEEDDDADEDDDEDDDDDAEEGSWQPLNAPMNVPS